MNKIPSDSIIVIDMAGQAVKLRVSGQHLIRKVQLMGFSLTDEFMILSVVDDEDKYRVIRLLIGVGAFFMYGHGWYPSELMEYYKEQGVKFDKYKVIYWTDKDTYHIEEQ